MKSRMIEKLKLTIKQCNEELAKEKSRTRVNTFYLNAKMQERDRAIDKFIELMCNS